MIALHIVLYLVALSSYVTVTLGSEGRTCYLDSTSCASISGHDEGGSFSLYLMHGDLWTQCRDLCCRDEKCKSFDLRQNEGPNCNISYVTKDEVPNSFISTYDHIYNHCSTGSWNYYEIAKACNTSMRVGTTVVWGDTKRGSEGTKGTVTSLTGTGSHKDGWISVRWGNRIQAYDHRWGRFGKADVRVYCREDCDTALKVGARVVRDEGFWSYGDEDGGPGSIGTITGMDNNVLNVHWQRVNHHGNYKWGQRGETDVKVYCQ